MIFKWSVNHNFHFFIDLDHFQMSASKLFSRPEKRCHHCIRRMSMNDSTSTTLTIWQHEQWCTLTLLQSWNYFSKNQLIFCKKLAPWSLTTLNLPFIFWWDLDVITFHVLNEKIFWHNALLLYTWWSDINFVTAKCSNLVILLISESIFAIFH